MEGVTTLLNGDDPIEKSSMLRPTCSEYKRAKIEAEYQTFKNETFNLFTSFGSWRKQTTEKERRQWNYRTVYCKSIYRSVLESQKAVFIFLFMFSKKITFHFFFIFRFFHIFSLGPLMTIKLIRELEKSIPS